MTQLGSSSEFEGLGGVYVNHSGMSPLPASARARMTSALSLMTTDPQWSRGMEQRERLRARLASFVGAESRHVGFVQNTTAAAHHVAFELDWRPRDAMILVEGEYPSNVIPWLKAARLFDVDVRWLPAWSPTRHDEWVSSLRELLLTHPVRLLALSSVAFQTGWRLPLAEISATLREARPQTLFYGDVIQGCGVAPLNMREHGLDAAGCGGHKWLMGTDGAGFLVLNDRIRAQLIPRLVGAGSGRDGMPYLSEGRGHLDYTVAPQEGALYVEGGSQNSLGYMALGVSLDILMGLGVDAIHAHVRGLHEILHDGLRDVHPGVAPLWSDDPAHRAGGYCCRVDDTALLKTLYEGLLERDVVASMPDGHLRISPHWHNCSDDARAVVAAVKDVVSGTVS